jgi:hypothetical protein
MVTDRVMSMPGCSRVTTESSHNLLFEISIQIRGKRFSPRRAPRRAVTGGQVGIRNAQVVFGTATNFVTFGVSLIKEKGKEKYLVFCSTGRIGFVAKNPSPRSAWPFHCFQCVRMK